MLLIRSKGRVDGLIVTASFPSPASIATVRLGSDPGLGVAWRVIEAESLEASGRDDRLVCTLLRLLSSSSAFKIFEQNEKEEQVMEETKRSSVSEPKECRKQPA